MGGALETSFGQIDASEGLLALLAVPEIRAMQKRMHGVVFLGQAVKYFAAMEARSSGRSTLASKMYSRYIEIAEALLSCGYVIELRDEGENSMARR